MTLGETIRKLRKARGLRQCDLASRLGVQPSLISGLETGARTHVGEQMLLRISEVLALSPEETIRLQALKREGRFAPQVVEIPAGATEAEIHAIQLLASCVGTLPALQFLALGQYLEQWRHMHGEDKAAMGR